MCCNCAPLSHDHPEYLDRQGGQELIAEQQEQPQVPENEMPVFLANMETTPVDVTGDGTLYKVLFDTIEIDTHQAYDPITGEFTAPISGYYNLQFSLHLLALESNHRQMEVELVAGLRNFGFGRCNPYDAGYVVVPDYHTISVPGSIPTAMLAGQVAYVQFSVLSGTKVVDLGSGGAAAAQTFFGGHMIRPI